MVKNVTGGNKSKGFARKGFIKNDSALRTSSDPAELYAQVVKILGGAACQVTTLEGEQLLCHIRGKFRGRGKRDNFIGAGSWLLVGLREWETEAAKGKLLNCDLIEVYSDSDKNKLKNSVTSVNWNIFTLNDTKKIGNESVEEADGLVFTDEKTQEYIDLIESQVSNTQHKDFIAGDNGEIINVDDI